MINSDEIELISLPSSMLIGKVRIDKTNRNIDNENYVYCCICLNTFNEDVVRRQGTFNEDVVRRQGTFNEDVVRRQGTFNEDVVRRQGTLPINIEDGRGTDCKGKTKFIKMNCCNQKLHKKCFLEWILYPITKNHNYNNKLYCIICKSKIKNLEDIIPLGDFINYIEKKQYETDDKKLISYYKKIISDFYEDSIVTIIINSEDNNEIEEYLNKELRFCFCNLFCIIFLFMLFILLILIGNIFVK